MNCIYIYKNNLTFNSEYELDGFLLRNYKLIEKYGDLIFQRKIKDNLQWALKYDFFLSQKEKVRELHAQGNINTNSHFNEFVESGELKGKKPYSGVTQFITEMRDPNSKSGYITPIFHEDDFPDEKGNIKYGYFSHKAQDWKAAKSLSDFSNDDIEVLFDKDEAGNPIFETVTDAIIERAKERLHKKWLLQAILGNIIHEIFRLYFLNDIQGFPLYEKEIDVAELKIIEKLKTTLTVISREGEPKKQDYMYNLISEDLIKQTISHCRNLYVKIVKNIGNGKSNNLMFLTEQDIVGEAVINENNGERRKIVGRLDLVVVDKYGVVHVFDYKTSPRDYFSTKEEDSYNSAKVRTFLYQLGIYRELLKFNNINTSINTYIVPLLLKDFHRLNNTDNFIYSSIEASSSDYYVNLTPQIQLSVSIVKNLKRYFPNDFSSDLSGGSIEGEVYDVILRWFPGYTKDKLTKKESVIKMLLDNNALLKNERLNKYIYRIGDRTIMADSESELVDKVQEEIDFKRNNIEELTASIISLLEQAQKTNEGEAFVYSGKVSSNVGLVDWLNKMLRPYATSLFEVLNSGNTQDYPDILNRMGIILLRRRFGNSSAGTITVLKISNSFLNELFVFGNSIQRKGLTGNFESDVIQLNKPGELLLQANRGNIELMETMLAINSIPNLFRDYNSAIDSISVINPYHQNSMSASNKELLYNFDELCKLSGYERSNMSIGDDDKPIHFLSFYQRSRAKFQDILTGNIDSKFGHYKSAVSDLDAAYGNPIEMRARLVALAKSLESDYYILRGVPKEKQSGHDELIVSLYNDIMYSISELDGYDYRQETEGHDNWMETLRVDNVSWRSLMLDNPGMLSSDTLNKATTAPRIAYQNVRLHIQNFYSILQEKVDALKKEKNLTWILRHVTGSELDYYKNLTYIDELTGDLMFKNPYDSNSGLTKAESDFLKWALIIINNRRFKDKKGDEIPDKEYYRVPLVRGGNNSIRLTKGGLLLQIKYKFANLRPSIMILRAKERMNGILTPDTRTKIEEGLLWEMSNMFDASCKEDIRMSLINDLEQGGVARFERNVETLLLKHECAYETKEQMDKIFPILKTAMLHLVSSGIIRNQSKSFDNDIQYLSNYIKNKIFNLSIVDENKRWIQAINLEVMQKASLMALAFSPHQLYLSLEGLWKTIKVYVQYMDNDNPMHFKFQDLKDSYFSVYSDLTKSISVTSKLNDLYGFNDRDMNVYIDRIKNDQSDFEDFAYRMASRPDYYNRGVLFQAQMRADGCYFAHHIDLHDRLVYDWTKDERFNIFAKYANDENNIPSSLVQQYNIQKGLYISMAQRFEQEQALNPDGSVFKMSKDLTHPVPLPRAYTVLQAESMKLFSDKLYGYYTHENKSLWQSTLIGGMMMQMNTFWSSKKNQYIGKGGINLQGHMDLYKENKYNENGEMLFILPDGTESTNPTDTPAMQLYWMKLDENGNLTKGITTDSTSGVPFMVWQGQYEEGIIMTLMKFGKILLYGNDNGEKGWSYAWKEIYNNDDINLRTAYRANLRLLFVDLLYWFLFGSILLPILTKATKENIKEVGNETIGEAASNTSKLWVVSMLDSSFDDANFLSSLAGRGVQVTPFAIQTMTRQFNNWMGIFGGKDFEDALVKTFAATRSTEPIWDLLKLSIRGRHIGQKAEE